MINISLIDKLISVIFYIFKISTYVVKERPCVCLFLVMIELTSLPNDLKHKVVSCLKINYKVLI